MKVADVKSKPGTIIETIVFGHLSGNYYTVTNYQDRPDKVRVHDPQGNVRHLHPPNHCAVRGHVTKDDIRKLAYGG